MRSIVRSGAWWLSTLTLILFAALLDGRTAQAQTVVTGNITQDTTWTKANSPYIVGQSYINAGVTLTIEPGVEVRFTSNGWLSTVPGSVSTLIAQGTEAEPIRFTSAAAAPSAGDWNSLYAYLGAVVNLGHCVVEYAGGVAAIQVYSSNVTVRDCTVRDNSGHGIQLVSAGLTPTFERVTVERSSTAIRQETIDMQPVYRGLRLRENQVNAVFVAGGNTSRNLTLDSTGVIEGMLSLGQHYIGAATTLTVTPGSTLSFRNSGWLSTVNGSAGALIAEGTTSRPIRFTSATTAPIAGDWNALYVFAQGTATLRHCVVEYANQGIYTLSSMTSVQQCQIRQNKTDGVFVSNATPFLRFNQLVGNGFGLRNATPATTVDARANWWGDASGPNHPTNNPAGLGNGVSDGVLFEPWFATATGMRALISPNRGGDIGEVTVQVFGELNMFKSGGEIRLTRAGQDAITAALTPISAGGDMAQATLNLAGKARGVWDVLLQIDATTLIPLPEAFTVEAGRPADVWVDLLGRENIAAGRRSTFTLLVGNRGNVDAPGALIGIGGLPPNAQIDLGVDVWQPDGSDPFDSFMPTRVISGELSSTIVLTRILPSTTIARQIAITVPDSADLELQVAAFAPNGMLRIGGASVSGMATAAALTALNDDRYAESDVAALSEAFDAVKPYEVADNWKGEFTNRACVGVTQDRNALLHNIALQPGSKLAGWEIAGGSTGWYGFGHTMTLLRSPSSGRVYGLDTYIGGTKVIPMEPDITGGYTYKYPASDIVHATLSSVMLDYTYRLGTLQTEFETLGQKCPSPTTKKKSKVRVVTSRDPNAKAGLLGYGENNYVNPVGAFNYVVMFENMPTASAPAQEVIITDQLDVNAFDLTTFALGPISFNDQTVIPQPYSQSFDTEVDLRPAQELIVRITASLNSATGVVTWHFKAIDPATGDLPEDPFLGLLPPNVNAPEGEGQVLFSIAPKAGLATGTVIRNRAEIVFDVNEPIITNEWVNVIDIDAPVSQVQPMPATQQSDRVSVNWAGSDAGAGVERYAVFVSRDGGPFQLWLANTAQTSATFYAPANGRYAFYSIARDGAGNIEGDKQAAEATTEITIPGSAVSNALYLPVVQR